MSQTPENLLEKIKSGDQQSFRTLFDLYYTELCRFALVYVKDKESAEDIVQNFFVHFWEIRENILINSSVKSYFYSSVRNRSLNYIRDNSRVSRFDEGIENYGLDDSQSEAQDYETDELKEMINKAIDTLPPKCKEIFLLSRTQELSYREIASKLDISIKTVENQISIALKKLHVELKPYRSLLFIMFLSYYDIHYWG